MSRTTICSGLSMVTDELLGKTLFIMERISRRYDGYIQSCIDGGTTAEDPSTFASRLLMDQAFMSELTDAYMFWRDN